MPKLDDRKKSTKEQKEKPSSEDSSSTKTIRVSFFLKEDHYKKLQALAWWGHTSMKDILERILEKFFSSKQIDPIPERKKKIEEFFEKD